MLPRGWPSIHCGKKPRRRERCGVGVEEELGLVSSKVKVPAEPGEKAMQRCVALPSSDSFTLKSLEGSGQLS